MRALATPAGIDHDYNFLSAIERGVERSDRVVVEEGLVGEGEVRGGRGFGVVRGRGGGAGRGGRGGGRGGGSIGDEWGKGEGDKKIARQIASVGIRMHRLPPGMARRKANGTSWSKKRGCVVWQMEWVVLPPTSLPREVGDGGGGGGGGGGDGQPQIQQPQGELGKVLATTPVGEAWEVFIEGKRRAALSPEEKTREKKRRAGDVAGVAAKRGRVDGGGASRSASRDAEGDVSTSQNLSSGVTPSTVGGATTTITTTATSLTSTSTTTTQQPAEKQHYKFYLHRPLTPSNGPIVLIPLRADEGLEAQLGGRTVLEFPKVYVFPGGGGGGLGEEFCVEGGEGEEWEGSEEEEEEGEGDEDEDEDEGVVEESDTSSSGSSSESEGESGGEGESGSGSETEQEEEP